MKKIGNTSTGSIIVEMAIDEYEALQRLQGLQQDSPRPQEGANGPRESMTPAERVAYVAERLKKLQPKKKDGVVRSIAAMFQFSGGIPPADIERVVTTLMKQKFFHVDPTGKVSYL